MKYYLAIKRRKILPFARISKKLQDIMLSAISQRKTNTAWYHFYVKSKKKNQTHRSKVEKWLSGAEELEKIFHLKKP